jgi:hypothetical protein
MVSVLPIGYMNCVEGTKGYASREYCESLAEFGEPLQLTASGGWLLKRKISGTPLCDAMGPYPLLACRDWTALAGDLDRLEGTLVSVAAVCDPFGAPDPEQLKSSFDHVVPFKDHYIVDLSLPASKIGSRRHWEYARVAQRTLDVSLVENPLTFTDEWFELYAELIRRKRLTGIKAFSRNAFRALLAMPSVTVFRVSRGQTPLAGQIWMGDEGVAFHHLTAMSAEGYRTRAAFALYAAAIEYFRGRVGYLDLGGGAGLGAADGLADFKRRWSTGTRATYFCGRVLNRSEYERLGQNHQTDYFPSYRQGEMA